MFARPGSVARLVILIVAVIYNVSEASFNTSQPDLVR